MTDAVNNPSHYRGKSGREAIEVTHQYRLGPDLTQAFDYTVRAGKKTADPRQDLQKAVFYLRYAANLARDISFGFPHSLRPSIEDVIEDFGLDALRAAAVRRILTVFPTSHDCHAAADALEVAIETWTRANLPTANSGRAA